MKEPIPEPVQAKVFAFADALTAARVPFRAVLLAGSFGRGEGVIRQSDNHRALVNDVDIVVVSDKPYGLIRRVQFRRLVKRLETQLAIPHIDAVLLSCDELGRAPLTMFRADLRDGAMVIAGDTKLLQQIHPHGGRLPWREAENLLINRLVTLFEGHPGIEGARSLEERARQLAKVLYAVIDAELIRRSCYVTRYAEKREGLLKLALDDASLNALAGEVPWIEAAWNLSSTTESGLAHQWEKVRQLHIAALRALWKGAGMDEHAALANWRGKRVPGAWETLQRLVRGLAERASVERELYREACKESVNNDRAARLIRSWYRSV